MRAYSSEYDEVAMKPNENVKAVVRRELAADRKYHTLVLGAPSVDITNMDTRQGIMEWHSVAAIASSHSMIESAEYALKTGRVEHVIITEHVPRYDLASHGDPHCVKPGMAGLANTTLHKAREQSGFSQSITIGSHSGLEHNQKQRSELFTNNGTNWNSRKVKFGKYDGLHLYS